MIELYKLINGALVSAPENIEINGQWHTPSTYDDLISEGYKPLVQAEKPPIEWYEKYVISYTESEKVINEVVTIAPSDSIIGQYNNDLLNELNRALENDFTWAGHVVKLTESNQKDYLAGFALANANPAMYIPMQYTFKDNVKHVMATLEELTIFTNQAFYFVSITLEAYRNERDKVVLMSDSELYDYVKAL